MLNLNEYVILDTETTGCKPLEDRITEIGFYLVKDGKVVKQWNSLINPQQAIPFYIQKLTGITDEMVCTAPYFDDIAAELHQLINSKVLVAHNARFDFGFLKQEFKRCGYDYRAKTLCTVKLSRKLFPDERQHSLDAISKRFDMHVTDRHRAMADTDMLLQFLNKLNALFDFEVIANAVNDCLKLNCLPAAIPAALINQIPNSFGVYQFYGENGVLLYVGKSISLRDRVLSHFNSDYSSTKELQMAQQVHHIDWIETPGELSALLLESQLVKKNQPIFNRKLRRVKTVYSFKLIKQPEAYHQVQIAALNKIKPEEMMNIYGIFKNKRSAIEKLNDLVKTEGLCAKYLGLEKTQNACFPHHLKICRGACVGNVAVDIYNQDLEFALENTKLQAWPYAGAVVIEESGSSQNAPHFHLFDKWCYIASAASKAELKAINLSQESYQFDLDIYRIILNYLDQNKINIDF